eukprot:TRINITY_DN103_c0_g1_i3.p1 TRINITY_DN103_c0_g1~~TRINITY_DN103_c0_g1_i3.p1  ORF type:complete len:116 (-),score=32.81 TRINITY_DN103_c0_g1_i3:320-667(-)
MNRESFEHVNIWLHEIDLYATNQDVVKLLVANKIDKDNRVVSTQEGIDFARSKSMVYIEASAKTKAGIQQTFEELVQKILDTPSLYSHSQPKPKTTITPVAHSEDNAAAASLCYC